MKKPISGTANEIVQTNRAIELSEKLSNRYDLTNDKAKSIACSVIYPNARNSIESSEMARAGGDHNRFLTDNLETAGISADGKYFNINAYNSSSSVSVTTADSSTTTSSIGYAVAVFRLPE